MHAFVDSRGTAEPGDDYVWQGRDALLDRYTIAVFPQRRRRRWKQRPSRSLERATAQPCTMA